MTELTEAYKVLSLHARARQGGRTGAEPRDLAADADTHAVLVSLHRQDAVVEAGVANG